MDAATNQLLNNLNGLVTGLFLLSAFGIVAMRQARGCLNLFIAQSILLAASATLLGMRYHSAHLYGLPKPAGMPMLEVNEISQKIVVEKPRALSLLGKSALTWHVQRKLESEYDRALLEFLSLYSNRLRRWMEQSINALRNAFSEFSDMHRAHFEAAPAASDASEIQKDLCILREWEHC